MTLGPAVPGACWLADQEISLAVTSCGCHNPASVQIARGCAGSVTSATILVVERCMTSTASRALGAPEQVACIAAHVGTATGLGGGLGDSDGLGDGEGLGEGVGVGVASSEGVGVGLAAVGDEPQPAIASSPTRANTPSLTGE
jgi:hypothetical protein